MQLRKSVFFPPFLSLVLAVVMAIALPSDFKALMTSLNAWVLHTFGTLFLLTGLGLLMVSILTLMSPFGSRTIGGPDAKPRLSRWQWFSINLTTSVAIGILFWGCAEPIYHLETPAPYDLVSPGSVEAAHRAMVTMFLHWTLIPYAMYAVPAVLFAYAFYNLNKSHCLGSLFSPLLGDTKIRLLGFILNPLCLFALATGMAASLGTGLLTLSGGLEQLIGVQKTSVTLALIALTIVGAFIWSSVRGLNSGISKLAAYSSWTLIGIVAFVFIAGPTVVIVNMFTESFPRFLAELPMRALAGGNPFTLSSWSYDWTVFYWAVWMAWAPITAIFLGQIAYGRTIRDFLLMNLLLPALFSAIWMGVFSGATLHLELTQHTGFAGIIKASGAEAASYTMFRQLPLAGLLIPTFVVISFLSFVSGADANTTAMAAISQKNMTQTNQEPSNALKIVWGLLIGIVSWIMVSQSDLDGIRMLSNLGGLPVLFLEIGCILSLSKLSWDSFKSPRQK